MIEFLGHARLFDPGSFYGQNALKAALLRATSGELDWHFIGHRPDWQLPARLATYHRVGDHPEAELDSIVDALGRRGGRIPAFCSFPVQSADLLFAVLRSRKISAKIALTLVFHCTAQELLPHLFGGGQTPRRVADAIVMAAEQGCGVVYASNAIRQSFELPSVVEYLGWKNGSEIAHQVIPNAIDSSWLESAPRRGLLRTDKTAFLVGSLAGFKPYKGRDIVTALLRHVQASSRAGRWTFAFAALPNYGTRELLVRVEREFQELLDEGRLLLFVDVSQWSDLIPDIVIQVERELRVFRTALPASLRRCWDRGFVGISHHPVHAQFSVQIRPSLHEGFGRAVIESLCVGVPVIGSDRDGLRSLLPADWLIPLPEALALPAAVAEPLSLDYLRACDDVGRAFLDHISAIEAAFPAHTDTKQRAEPYLDSACMVFMAHS